MNQVCLFCYVSTVANLFIVCESCISLFCELWKLDVSLLLVLLQMCFDLISSSNALWSLDL